MLIIKWNLLWSNTFSFTKHHSPKNGTNASRKMADSRIRKIQSEPGTSCARKQEVILKTCRGMQKEH